MADSDQSPFNGRTRLTCRDGRRIRLEEAWPRVSVVVERQGVTLERADLPFPKAGYGGHELLLSPDEAWLALWLYSGQSEVGYELFELRPALRHIASLPYVFGEGEGPVFSADARLFALAWAIDPGIYPWDVEADDDGCTVAEHEVEWAAVHLRRLPDGAVSTCTITVRLPAGSREGEGSWYPSELAVEAGEVRLRTGWGTLLRLPIPLPLALTIDGPPR